MTGHHRGPKRDYNSQHRGPARNVTKGDCDNCRVWYCTLSLRCACTMHVFDVWASSSPLGYLCAKFRYCCGPHCWASPWRKIVYSVTHSLTQLIWCPGNRSKIVQNTFLLLWPWAWPEDINIRTRPKSSEDRPTYQKYKFLAEAFKS